MSSEQDFKIKYLSYKMKYLKLKQLDNEANGGGALTAFLNQAKNTAKKKAEEAAKQATEEAKKKAGEAAKQAKEEATEIAQNIKNQQKIPDVKKIDTLIKQPIKNTDLTKILPDKIKPTSSPTNRKYDSNNINDVREQLEKANRTIAEYQVLLNSRE